MMEVKKHRRKGWEPPPVRFRFTWTEMMWVDVPRGEAPSLRPYTTTRQVNGKTEKVTYSPDITDVSEMYTRARRISRFDWTSMHGDIEVEEEDGTPWADVVDISQPERYIWSARHFVMKARQELSSGRYREGNCPELDQVNGALARLEDELRLMALEIDRPEFEEVKAWRQKKTEEAKQKAASTR